MTTGDNINCSIALQRAYHLLDFNDQDIQGLRQPQGINTDAFRKVVHDAGCEEEIRNPFGLTVTLERFKVHGRVSRLPFHDKPVDRRQELAFVGATPVETWQNAITYLADMSDRVRDVDREWVVRESSATPALKATAAAMGIGVKRSHQNL